MNRFSSFFLSLRYVLAAFLFSCFSVSVFAQGFPNTTQGAPGTLLQGPVAPEMGRTAIIEYIGGYIITWPEGPGSEAGDDLIVRAWDLSNPSSPREVRQFGQTWHPMNAHGTIKRGRQVYLGGNPFEGNGDTAIAVDSSGNISLEDWRGPFSSGERNGLFAPWNTRGWWSYGIPQGNAYLELDGVRLSEWDHLSLTGVVGFPHIMGNTLIFASDQSHTGVAAYDISNPANPVLLDVLNTSVAEGGIGGYWSEIYGHYVVIARRSSDSDPNSFAGIQVVDFSDPNNLRLHCNMVYSRPTSPGSPPDQLMYVGFQDEYVFSERVKLNINTCTTELILPSPVGTVDTSQYSRPLGNLLVTGGAAIQPNIDGMGVWVHQSAPDTRSPFVSYHIPRNNQTNYPVNFPLTVHIPETLRSETIVVTETPELGSNQTLTLTEVGGSAVRIDYLLTHTGLLMIDPVDSLTPNTTYELRLTSGIQDAAGNGLEAYSFRFSTGSSVNPSPTPNPDPTPDPEPDPTPDPISPPVLSSVIASPDGSVEIDEFVTITAFASDGSGEATEYQFELDNQGDWTTASSQNFQFSEAGVYTVNVRARNSAGVSGLQTIQVRVLEVGQALSGNYSSQLYCAANTGTVWGVNPDNNSVVALDSSGLSVNLEHFGVDDPRSVAVSSRGHVWVTSMGGDRIDVFNDSGNRIRQLNTDYGSAPYGIVMSPDGNTAYVSLYGSGEVARFDTQAISETGRIALGPTPRALALTPDGNRLLVTRFISAANWGEVWDINTVAWSLTRTIRLDKNLVEDAIDNGRGVPNYLSAIIVNGQGTRAYLVGKKDNVDRGLLNGIGLDLDDDNSVRAMGLTIDLSSNQELRGERIDFDNADSPSSLALSTDGATLFVGLQGINQVFAVSVNNDRLGNVSAQLASGRAPQGLCIDYAVNRLFVKNFMERTINAIDVGGSLLNPFNQSISTVSNETLSADVLAGKRIFYDAANGRQTDQFVGKMSAEGYISCATCHIDGGHDGRTYDFTGRQEGIRNNISLKGRNGTRFGNVHWTGNFDEIQDFEHDIRNAFRGSGFMDNADFADSTPLGAPKAGLSVELDQLAAYVSSLGQESLPKSPYRQADGSMTDAALRGRDLFAEMSCADCHSGEGFTDGLIHDVGTLRTYSGSRLGESIPGLKTPSLLSVFDTAPYLHDGSAATLRDVFTTVGGEVFQAEDLQSDGQAVAQAGSNYSYLRDARAMRVEQGGFLQLNDVDGGSGGEGFLRIRYGSIASLAQLEVMSDGRAEMLRLESQPQVAGQDVALIDSVSVPVNLSAGPGNVVRIAMNNLGGAATILVDDVTVSNADDLAQANPHAIARFLTTSEVQDLEQYLLQIDRFQSEEDSSDPSGSGGSDSGSNSSSSSSSSSDEEAGSLGLYFVALMLLLILVRACQPRTQTVRVD